MRRVPAQTLTLTWDDFWRKLLWHVLPALTCPARSAFRWVSPTFTVSVRPLPTRSLEATGINPDTRVKDLTLEEEAKIRDYIDQANIIVEGDLRRNVALDIKRLVEIQSFRGTRHRKNLPCRGQRTKTNARTCKGPKRTVANKKK